MRRLLVVFFVLVCMVGISLGFVYWPSLKHRYKKMNIDKGQENSDIARTKELLNNSKPEEAFEIIQQYSEDLDNRTEEGKEWIDLLIRASEATFNTQQLIVLYEYYPKAFDSHEKAAMLVADAYLVGGRGKDYQALRDSWKGRETKPETWFILDADKMLLDGKRREAVDFLNSRTFPGKSDTARLIRLALLYIFEEPKTAWDYLTQAYNKDPENPEIRSYRAKLLETVGKNSLALSEYVAAVQTDPKNLYLKDQLAEFYLRLKQYPLALEIWTENLKAPSLDFFWIKALFWNRLIMPIKFDWSSVKPPQGKLEPLIEYLIALPSGQFWDASAFDRLPQSQQYLKSQQVTYWLRVLAALKNGKEKEAYDLLLFNPFQTVSWNPKLEDELKKIMVFRKTGKFSAEEALPASSSKEEATSQPMTFGKNEHVLFAQLDFLKKNPPNASKGQVIPADLKELLEGPDAFSAAFLAAGWSEAALQLNTQKVIPSTYPEWYAFELTQAMRQNRSPKAALDFAKAQHPTEPLSLLTGELLIALGDPDAALERLTPLSKEDNDIGYRAAWMISLIHIDRAQYAEAKAAINDQPRLAKEILGQETLARIALLQGDTNLADQLYISMEKTSSEAKSYLARKAYAEKDWKRARELTEQLLSQYPTNALLLDNLKKIVDEQNKTQTVQ